MVVVLVFVLALWSAFLSYSENCSALRATIVTDSWCVPCFLRWTSFPPPDPHLMGLRKAPTIVANREQITLYYSFWTPLRSKDALTRSTHAASLWFTAVIGSLLCLSRILRWNRSRSPCSRRRRRHLRCHRGLWRGGRPCGGHTFPSDTWTSSPHPTTPSWSQPPYHPPQSSLPYPQPYMSDVLLFSHPSV